MSRFLGFLILVQWVQFSVAQAVNTGELVLDAETERARIQTERKAAETRFSQQEAACYARFIVTKCLEDVRLSQRHLLDDLRRQTVVLNDLERQKKALSKIDLINRKSDAQKPD